MSGIYPFIKDSENIFFPLAYREDKKKIDKTSIQNLLDQITINIETLTALR